MIKSIFILEQRLFRYNKIIMSSKKEKKGGGKKDKEKDK